MTSKLTYLGSCGAIALAVAFSAPAIAGGTLAGSSISNTATVNYNVGTVAQAPVADTEVFVVDRKIDLTVAEVAALTTNVVPGQTSAVTTFTLQNTSNAVLDFALVATQTAGGTAAHGGTDTFNMNNVLIYRDTNSSGSYEAGTDLAVTFIDELAIDATVRLFVVADVPAGQANGSVANVRLTATGREGGAAGLGVALTQTGGANTAAMDTVFADAAGPADGVRDAAHSDDDDYTVVSATIAVDKTVLVLSDPVNGVSPNAKMIPGAVVQYCISVVNSGAADALNVAINDPLPANITFVAGSIRLNGTMTGAVCNTDGVAGGTFASNTVSGTLGTVTAATTRTLVFQATVN